MNKAASLEDSGKANQVLENRGEIIMRFLNQSLLISGIFLTASFCAVSASGADKSTSGGKVPQVADFNEATHMIFMREEEKLARDVYLTLGEKYPRAIVFKNIVNSEQQHTTTVRDKLAKYNIADPNPDTDEEGFIGVFTGEDYGWYFTEKYKILTTWGEISKLNALYVGAYIEELDMLDIVQCPAVIQESYDIGEDDCGLDYTDNSDLQRMLGSLLEGSKNHLHSYVENIEAVKGECSYEAQILTQLEVDTILGRVGECDYDYK